MRESVGEPELRSSWPDTRQEHLSGGLGAGADLMSGDRRIRAGQGGAVRACRVGTPQPLFA